MIELRRPHGDDARVLFPLLDGTGVLDTLVWDGPQTEESLRQSLEERAAPPKSVGPHFFVIVDKVSGHPIGTCDLRVESGAFRGEVGLWIGKPFQGRGIGTEVVRRLLDHGFRRLHLEKIEASVFVGNWSSRRIFEKNGFQLEGTIRKTVRKHGEFLDEWLLGITREDYPGWEFPEKKE